MSKALESLTEAGLDGNARGMLIAVKAGLKSLDDLDMETNIGRRVLNNLTELGYSIPTDLFSNLSHSSIRRLAFRESQNYTSFGHNVPLEDRTEPDADTQKRVLDWLKAELKAKKVDAIQVVVDRNTSTEIPSDVRRLLEKLVLDIDAVSDTLWENIKGRSFFTETEHRSIGIRRGHAKKAKKKAEQAAQGQPTQSAPEPKVVEEKVDPLLVSIRDGKLNHTSRFDFENLKKERWELVKDEWMASTNTKVKVMALALPTRFIKDHLVDLIDTAATVEGYYRPAQGNSFKSLHQHHGITREVYDDLNPETQVLLADEFKKENPLNFRIPFSEFQQGSLFAAALSSNEMKERLSFINSYLIVRELLRYKESNKEPSLDEDTYTRLKILDTTFKHYSHHSSRSLNQSLSRIIDLINNERRLVHGMFRQPSFKTAMNDNFSVFEANTGLIDFDS